MTFKEIKEQDSYNAYQDWITFRHAKDIGLIPEKYWEFFPDICTCGSENIIKFSLKQSMCCNPRCYVKQGFALSEFLQRFNIDGFGSATCTKIYNSFLNTNELFITHGKKPLLQTKSPLELVLIDFVKYPSDIAFTEKGRQFYEACQKIRNTPTTFKGMMANIGIRGVNKNADSLFSGINSWDDLANAIKSSGSVMNFCEMRGVHAPMTAESIRQSLEDIYVASIVCQNSLIQEGLKKIDICITGRVTVDGIRLTKKEFIDKCNSVCIDSNGTRAYEINMTTAISSVPFVIYSEPATNTSKYVAALNRGVIKDEFGTHPVLVTADKFLSILEGVMDKWEIFLRETLKVPQQG